MQGLSLSTRRSVTLLLLGFASGLPLALSADLLSAWLTNAGFEPAKIGLLGLVGLPYAIKVLWSPLVDRYTPPFWGRRRGWMAATQILLIGAIVILSMTDPNRSLPALAGAAALAAGLSATQDTVIDAWRADLLEPDQRGPGSALSVSGYRLGMIFSSAGGLILTGKFHVPWPTTCRWIAAAMGIGLIGSFLAEEPKAAGAPKSLRQAVVHPLRGFFLRPGGWIVLLFVLIFKLPEHLVNAMSIPFFLKSGIPQADVGTVRQCLGIGLTIAGALAGGGIVRWLGHWRSLWIFGILHSISNLAFLVLARTGANYPGMVAVISIESICIGLTTAGLMAWMIGQCDARYSAFQFALLSGVMALGRVGAYPLAGWLAGALGWPAFFAVSALFGLPGMLLLPWLRSDDATRRVEDKNEAVIEPAWLVSPSTTAISGSTDIEVM